jgi:hypothetical protein
VCAEQGHPIPVVPNYHRRLPCARLLSMLPVKGWGCRVRKSLEEEEPMNR